MILTPEGSMSSKFNSRAEGKREIFEFYFSSFEFSNLAALQGWPYENFPKEVGQVSQNSDMGRD